MKELVLLLEQGINDLGLTLTPQPFMQYLVLLEKWNKAYNLTAVRDLPSMVSKHVLDSLAILPFLRQGDMLDVGSGAGLPGIPIAMAEPDRRVVVLDSNGKKTRFMSEAKRILGLDNLQVVQSRVEDYQPEALFQNITSRAFTDVSSFITLTKHLLAPDGQWLAMKAKQVDTELAGLTYPYQIMPYTIPGLPAERCCVLVGQ